MAISVALTYTCILGIATYTGISGVIYYNDAVSLIINQFYNIGSVTASYCYLPLGRSH